MAAGRTTAAAQEVRRPGRPRSAEAEQAILLAALRLMAEVGFDEMSVEAIAARAGVGKATIYRRWPSKEAIVLDAIRRTFAQVTFPDTGSAKEDLAGAMGSIIRAVLSTGLLAGATGASKVIASITGNPQLMRVYWDQVVSPARAQMRRMLERGIERGEVRSDLDIEIALDMLPGSIFFRVIMAQVHKPPTPEFVRQVADSLWRGFAAKPLARPARSQRVKDDG